MKTLEHSPTPADDRSENKSKTSFPREIIEELLSRLLVKSILRFRSVSKPWLSLISAPSFPTLHSSRSHRTALFISGYDSSTQKRYFLSAAHDGGPLTHITTVDTFPLCSRSFSESEHLNGLVCYSSANNTPSSIYALVINPSTHKSFKLPDLTLLTESCNMAWGPAYLFGFDESRNEHKVLHIRKLTRGTPQLALGVFPRFDYEVYIFSLSDYTWRKINVVLPTDDIKPHHIRCSVCVGSVIHFMWCHPFDITFDVLKFDLRTENFSTVDVPDERAFRELSPDIKKINGSVALVGSDVYNNQVVIWMLHDYESRFLVRETVTFPEAWGVLDPCFSIDSVSTDDIVFASRRLSRGVKSVYLYNMKTRCFRQVEFILTHPFLCLDTVEFDQVKCYVESLVPLKGNGARIS